MSTRLRPIAAATLAFCVAAGSAAAQSRETEQVDRTIPFQPGGTLTLKNFSGDIRITGAETGEVTIHAVRRATRERLDRIKLTIETSGSALTINANDRGGASGDNHENNVVETSFEIGLPRLTSLDVTSFSSAITVDNVEGRHKINNFSGDLRLTRVAGPVRAKTFSGDVDLQLPAASGADLQFNSFSGDVETDLPLTLVSRSRRNLRATINGGGADVRVKTFSGDVRLNR